jgi:hypothetical protein
MPRVGIAIVMLLAMLAACATPPAPSITGVPGTTAPTFSAVMPSSSSVADHAGGIAFDRPANWVRWLPNMHDPITDGPMLYLSTDPLQPTCAVLPSGPPNPADVQGRACDWPLTTLSPGGVLVTWWNDRILSPIPSPDEPLTINGGSSGIRVERPGTCAAIGSDETVEAAIPLAGSPGWTNLVVIACLRGPDVASAETQLREMLRSAAVQG